MSEHEQKVIHEIFSKTRFESPAQKERIEKFLLGNFDKSILIMPHANRKREFIEKQHLKEEDFSVLGQIQDELIRLHICAKKETCLDDMRNEAANAASRIRVRLRGAIPENTDEKTQQFRKIILEFVINHAKYNLSEEKAVEIKKKLRELQREEKYGELENELRSLGAI